MAANLGKVSDRNGRQLKPQMWSDLVYHNVCRIEARCLYWQRNPRVLKLIACEPLRNGSRLICLLFHQNDVTKVERMRKNEPKGTRGHELVF